MNRILMSLVGMGCLALIVAGCGAITSESRPIANETATARSEINLRDTAIKEKAPIKATETSVMEPSAEATSAVRPLANLAEVPQPINELVDDDYTWSQLLVRDAIVPIYDPQFVPADQAPYDDNELVIGVEINGEARAYAIGPLNSREMVNDIVGGVPILVTW